MLGVYLSVKCAGVAQLVEQLTCNQQVAGSSPIASFFSNVQDLFLFLARNEESVKIGCLRVSLGFSSFTPPDLCVKVRFLKNLERFPSGQREQTVNLSATPSEVRILPSPPASNMVLMRE